MAESTTRGFRYQAQPPRPLVNFCRLQAQDLAGMFRQAVMEWIDDQGQRLGASLAFYSLLSMAPLLVISVAVAGVFFGRTAAEGQLAWQIQNFVGLEEAKVIQLLLEGARRPAVGFLATALSVAMLLMSASSVVADLQGALNSIWHVGTDPTRRFPANILYLLKERLFSFVLVLSGGVVLLASVALSTWVAALGKFFRPFYIPEAFVHAGISLLSFLLVFLVFAAIYKILPDVPLAWTDVLVGAAVSSLLFDLGKQLIALYLGKVGLGSTYGAAGSLTLILVWIYYAAQLFFLGAEFTKVYARRRGSHRFREAPSEPRN